MDLWAVYILAFAMTVFAHYAENRVVRILVQMMAGCFWTGGGLQLLQTDASAVNMFYALPAMIFALVLFIDCGFQLAASRRE